LTLFSRSGLRHGRSSTLGFLLCRESLQLIFSSSPVAASVIFILLLPNSTARVGNLLRAELSSRVHRLDSAARSQLPPRFIYPAVVLLVSFLAAGIAWFCVSALCSCKSSFCFESITGESRSCS
jgi:hypothetical protein